MCFGNPRANRAKVAPKDMRPRILERLEGHTHNNLIVVGDARFDGQHILFEQAQAVLLAGTAAELLQLGEEAVKQLVRSLLAQIYGLPDWEVAAISPEGGAWVGRMAELGEILNVPALIVCRTWVDAMLSERGIPTPQPDEAIAVIRPDGTREVILRKGETAKLDDGGAGA